MNDSPSPLAPAPPPFFFLGGGGRGFKHFELKKYKIQTNILSPSGDFDLSRESKITLFCVHVWLMGCVSFLCVIFAFQETRGITLGVIKEGKRMGR